MPHIVSANRLTDGRIVFRTAAGGWDEALPAALLLNSKAELEAAMESARADMAANRVVEVEAVEVRTEPGGLTAVTMRDKIRIAGPSVLTPSAPHPAPARSEQNDVSI